MAYVYTAYVVHFTIFSTGGKFHPVSNFMELDSSCLLCALGVCILAVNCLPYSFVFLSISVYADLSGHYHMLLVYH